jgi:hypothetical protein
MKDYAACNVAIRGTISLPPIHIFLPMLRVQAPRYLIAGIRTNLSKWPTSAWDPESIGGEYERRGYLSPPEFSLPNSTLFIGNIAFMKILLHLSVSCL